MIGQRQIVVNRLGTADEPLRITLDNRIVGKLFDRIHGIVSANIDEGFDFQLLQDFENLLIYFRILVNFRQLIPAGTEKRSGRPL